MAKRTTLDWAGAEYRVVRARNRLALLTRPRGDTSAAKFFVIGHPRNGTGTLHRIFLANGLHSTHTAGTWKTAEFDCFSDRGNYQPIELLAERYPNARFVLNTRPAYNYIRSRINQIAKKRRNKKMPQPRVSARNVANEIVRRNDYFLDCLRLFERLGERFVIANIEHPRAFPFICQVLDLEYEQEIWHNRAPSRLGPEVLDRVDAGFRRLGVEQEAMEPFIIRSLLPEQDIRRVDRFLEQQRERVLL
jgi:hypothetical protein